MRPKTASRSKKAPARGKTPLDPRIFPAGAQAGSTSGRESVRQSVHLVRAPRQSQRPVERTSKKKG